MDHQIVPITADLLQWIEQLFAAAPTAILEDIGIRKVAR